jgi:sulfate adenylyltransferase
MKTNRQLHIDKEALITLSLLKEGLLFPATKLMDEKKAKEVDETGIYKGVAFPFSFILAPSGKTNEKVLTSIEENETLDLFCDKRKVGTINVDGVFKIDIEHRVKSIYGIVDDTNIGVINTRSRLGNYAVHGEFEIEDTQITDQKKQVQDAIEKVDAKNVSSMVLTARPFHRVHERLIRTALVKCDLLIIFVDREYTSKEEVLPFDLRFKTVEHFVENYLHRDRVVVLPLEHTYIFAGVNGLMLNATLMRNFGSNKFIIGKNHPGLGAFYENRHFNTIVDSFENINIDIEMMSEFVYCNECKTLVSTNTCPHGRHHHILYHTSTILELLKLGILPPAILMRPEISSMILNRLYPEKSRQLLQIHQQLSPSSGLLDDYESEDFYKSLMGLYQTSSLT